MYKENKFGDALLHIDQCKIIALNYRKYEEQKAFMEKYNNLIDRYLSGERTDKLLQEMNDLWI